MSQYQVDIFLIKTMDYSALEGPDVYLPDEIHMLGVSLLKVQDSMQDNYLKNAFVSTRKKV
jgi:hypothetical protein